MNKTILCSITVLLVGAFGFMPEVLAKDVIELKTYYPSPSGIYDTLRVAPRSTEPVKCNNSNAIGTYYYDSDGIYDPLLGHNSPAGVYVCNGSEWVAMGGGDSLWKKDDVLPADPDMIIPEDDKKVGVPQGVIVGKGVADGDCAVSKPENEGLIRYNTTKHIVEFCDDTGTWQPAFSKTIVGACNMTWGVGVADPFHCWGYARYTGVPATDGICSLGTKKYLSPPDGYLDDFICVLGLDDLEEPAPVSSGTWCGFYTKNCGSGTVGAVMNFPCGTGLKASDGSKCEDNVAPTSCPTGFTKILIETGSGNKASDFYTCVKD